MARILVIDDDDQVREMLRQMIHNAGHEVALAADGDGGIALYKEQPADLIVTDIVMPRQGRLGSNRRASEGISSSEDHRDFRRRSARAVQLSGHGQNDSEPQRVFAKPIEKTALLQAITDLLRAAP